MSQENLSTTGYETGYQRPVLDPTSPVLDPTLTGDGLQDRLQSSIDFHVRESSTDVVRRTLKDLEMGGLSPDILAKAEVMVVDGKFEGHEVSMPEIHKDAQSVIEDRCWLAAKLKSKPEVARAIIDNEVVGFHATSSFALAGLIEDGALLSGRELHDRGKASITGAHDADLTGKGQRSISFGKLSQAKHNIGNHSGGFYVTEKTDAEVVEGLEADVKEREEIAAENPEGSPIRTVCEASAQKIRMAIEEFKSKPNSLKATLMRLSFPVAVGISAEGVTDAENRRENNVRILFGQSDQGEFRLGVSEIPLADLPVIAVPRGENDRVINGTRAVLDKFGHNGIKVIPLEDLVEAIPGITDPLMNY